METLYITVKSLWCTLACGRKRLPCLHTDVQSLKVCNDEDSAAMTAAPTLLSYIPA